MLGTFIGSIFTGLFGGGRNVVKETAEVFTVNKEARDQRRFDLDAATLAQFASEFQHERRGIFDRFIDGLNRLPRPMITLSTLGLVASAMIDPIWFAARMEGLTLVPQELWWIIGVVITFYFGSRHGEKITAINSKAGAALPAVLDRIKQIEGLRAPEPREEPAHVPLPPPVDAAPPRAAPAPSQAVPGQSFVEVIQARAW